MNILLNELSFSQQAQNNQDAERLMLQFKDVLETIAPVMGDGKRYIRRNKLPHQQIQYGVTFREWIVRIPNTHKELKWFFISLLGNGEDVESYLYDVAPSHLCTFNNIDVSFSTIAGGAHLDGILVCLGHSPTFLHDTIQVQYNSNGTNDVQTTITTISDVNQIWGKYRPRFVRSSKHTPGGWGTLMDLNDQIAQQVMDNGVFIDRQIYGYYKGKFYEFKSDNAGGFHGYPIYELKLPPTAKEKLRIKGVI